MGSNPTPSAKFRSRGFAFDIPNFPVDEMVRARVNVEIRDHASVPSAAIDIAASIKEQSPGDEAYEDRDDVSLDTDERGSKAK